MSATTTVAYVTPQPAVAPPGQPDIGYAPDYEKWRARAARRLKAAILPTTLPEGFPAQLKGDLVWDGDTVADSYNWTYVFNDEQLAEIDGALRHFQGLGLPTGHVSQETFPLPSLHAELRRLSADELHNGHGFFVLRGLRVDDYMREENVIIYAGISSHIGALRGRQDTNFDGREADVVLTHIKDMTWLQNEQQQQNGAPNGGAGGGGGGGGGKIGSPAYTTDKQVFHTDSGDIVSLFALETSAAGGASKLASTWRVYNEIAATRPDLIHTLAQSWDMEILDKFTEKLYVVRPLLFHFPATETTPQQRIALQYARRYFVGFGRLPRNPEIPPITEAQAEALDTLQFLGERFCVDTHFRKGDMQYVNNLAVFHARDGFEDTPKQRRHLLRLWLRDPENAWKTPEMMAWRWKELYDGITPGSEVLPTEPFIRSAGRGK